MFLPQTYTHAQIPNKRAQGKFGRCCFFLLSWLLWWFHGCVVLFKLINLYTLNTCSSLYINYTSIMVLKMEINWLFNSLEIKSKVASLYLSGSLLSFWPRLYHLSHRSYHAGTQPLWSYTNFPYGCCNKLSQTWCLKIQKNYSLPVLEARSLKSQ